jgi:hypothetical protein
MAPGNSRQPAFAHEERSGAVWLDRKAVTMIGRQSRVDQTRELQSAMRSLGRALQLFGLAVPPLAILLQLFGSITLGQMLTMLVAAVCLFGIGRILEGYAR